MSVKIRVNRLEQKQGVRRCMVVTKKGGESDDEALARAITEQGFTPGPDDVVVWLKNFSSAP
jgi:hypothetical protein